MLKKKINFSYMAPITAAFEHRDELNSNIATFIDVRVKQ